MPHFRISEHYYGKRYNCTAIGLNLIFNAYSSVCKVIPYSDCNKRRKAAKKITNLLVYVVLLLCVRNEIPYGLDILH
jgi:hypothetical protein